MPSDSTTQLLRVPWTLYAGDMINADATPGLDVTRTVPINCRITAVYTSAAAITASSQYVVEILRATTIVATLTTAVPYVPPVVVAATGLDIRLSFGDLLTVRVRGVDADSDDITGLIVEATLQPLLDAPGS